MIFFAIANLANIFRKVTRLGKISEENLNGGEKVNGDLSMTHLECSDVEEEKDGSSNIMSFPKGHTFEKSDNEAKNLESTVTIPNTNADEQSTLWEEKAIPATQPNKENEHEEKELDRKQEDKQESILETA